MELNPLTTLRPLDGAPDQGPALVPEVESFGHLSSIRRAGFAPVGFHQKNLEVASISPAAHRTLKNRSFSDAAAAELEAWNESVNPDVLPGTIHFGARSVTINVTQVCNLHCTYCAAGGDGTFGDPVKKISVEKTLPQLKSLLDKVPAGKKFNVTFLGGEPLLYPEGIRLIADYVRATGKERGLRTGFTVVTNGTLFTPANIELVCELRANISVSIDGPPELNDRTRPSRGGAGVTARAVDGIKKLLERKAELGGVELAGVFGKQNLELLSAYEFYSALPVDCFEFIYDHLETSPEISAAFTRALIEVADRAYAEGGEKGLRRIKNFDRIFELLDNQQQVENYCGAGKTFFMIDARNSVYTCPWVVGDAREIVGHGTELWTERLKSFEAPLVEANGCGSCWARNLCGGGCMFIHKNKTGSKNRVDENFCTRTKDLIASAILYYERSREAAL